MLHGQFSTIPEPQDLCRHRSCLALYGLVLDVAGGARVLVVSRKDHGPTAGAAESFSNHGRAVGADGGANGHEEAVAALARTGTYRRICIPKRRR